MKSAEQILNDQLGNYLLSLTDISQGTNAVPHALKLAVNIARIEVLEEIKSSINENAITGYLYAGNPKELLLRLNLLIDKRINELR